MTPIDSDHDNQAADRSRTIEDLQRALAELERAEADLRARQEETAWREQMLAESQRVARVGSWRVHLDDGRLELSAEACRLVGVDPDAMGLTQADFDAMVHPEDLEHFRTRREALFREGGPDDIEIRIVLGDGAIRHLHMRGEIERDTDGNPLYFTGTAQDITDFWDAHERLRQYQYLVESSQDYFCVIDAEYRYTFCDESYARLYGLDRTDIEGRYIWEVRGRAFFEREVRQPIQQCLTGEPQTFEAERIYEGLGLRQVYIRYYPIPSADGVIRQVASAITDITDLKQARAEVERNAAALAERVKELRCMQQVADILDRQEAPLEQRLAAAIGHVPAGWQFPDQAVACLVLDGQEYATADYRPTPLRLSVPVRVRSEEVGSLTVCYRDSCAECDEAGFLEEEGDLIRMLADKIGHAVEREQAEHELRRLAYEDPVSGLLTRNGFIDALTARLRERGWDPHGMLVGIDIEGLRNINDSFGYEVGDQLLASLGERLQELVQADGCAGRVGGDEFIVFLAPQPGDDIEAQRAALARIFETGFDVAGIAISAAAKFGHTMLGDTRRSPEILLHEAEVALFEDAKPGLGAWGAYTPDLDRGTRARIELVSDLRQALSEGQFELAYQPKVRLASGELLGCEALLRWHHPTNGWQSPERFIPAAEQSQLMAPIGDWVLFEACRQMREWQDAGMPVGRMAINVSIVQFRLGRFAEQLRAAIAHNGVDPVGLTLEITESVFEQESGVLYRQLRELHELGVRLSLDDFGTGYSSLLYLQRYPFNEIKIDMGFVRHILDDTYSRRIVATVLGIAGAIEAEAVAEGVESTAVRDALLEMGCTTAQGYYFSRPLPPVEFARLLRQGGTLPRADSATA